MPTPIRVFGEVAARHGGVDPHDAQAVQDWYEKTLPTLPGPQAEAIIEELVTNDGPEEEHAALPRRYPDRAAVPALDEAVPARVPLLAAFLWLLRRLRRSRRPVVRD